MPSCPSTGSPSWRPRWPSLDAPAAPPGQPPQCAAIGGPIPTSRSGQPELTKATTALPSPPEVDPSDDPDGYAMSIEQALSYAGSDDGDAG
jgi:hypothetical protein